MLDSASANAVPSAVLLLVTSDGQQLAQTISNEHGEFALTMGPGAYALRVLRLGYRPRLIPLAQRAAAQPIEIVLARPPTMLEPVVTISNPLCPRRENEEQAFAMWEQARSGLLASVVSRDAKAGRATVFIYRRSLTSVDDSDSPMRVRIESGVWSRPFGAALTPASFVRSGFVRPDSGGMSVYFGPDADVLLNETFQSAYCFSIAQDAGRRDDQIGLRFAPASRRRGRADIEGTLWIDTVARVLRDVDFRYVGLPPGADRHRPGGRVVFREMPNGLVIVDRWFLRMLSDKPGGQNWDRQFFLSEGGGAVAAIDWDDGTTWKAALGTLRVRAVTADGAPVPGMRLRLDSTEYPSAITDSAGYASIIGILPGPYEAALVDSALATLGLELGLRFSFMADAESAVETTLEVRSTEELVAANCQPGTLSPSRNLVIARVVSAGKPAKGVRWQVGAYQGTTAADGVLRACVPADVGQDVEVMVWPEKGPSPTRVRVPLRRRLATARIDVP